jgi:GT2 family glycosyltransferase
MTTNVPDLSIVIVNYNTCNLLLDLLESIYTNPNHSFLQFECIVIDNASSDGSAAEIPARYPQVRFVANAQNRFFSAAYTQGIQQAEGRYILAINPDMVVEGNTLAQLVQQMDADSTIGAATTTMHSRDGELQRNGSRFVTLNYLLLQYTFWGKLLPQRFRAARDWLWYADWDRTSRRAIDVLPGCCIIASRETWAAVGGFDDRMLIYFSDDYVSRAVQRLGKQTVYLVSDGIIHYEGASTRIRRVLTPRFLRIYFHDLLVYTRLIFGRPTQVMLAILLIPTWIVQRLKAS